MLRYAIVGRVGTGKTALATALENAGFSRLKTSTTRAKRSEKDIDHFFLTKEQADAIPQDQKLLQTMIGPHEYFADKANVEACSVAVVDPQGVYDIAAAFPEDSVHVVYVTAQRPNDARNHALARETDKTHALDIYTKRCADEDARFTEFESVISDEKQIIAPNCRIIHRFVNDFTEPGLLAMAASLAKYAKIHENLENLAAMMIDLGVIQSVKPGFVKLVAHTPDSDDAITGSMSIPCFADWLLGNDTDMASFMYTVLSHDLTVVLDNPEDEKWPEPQTDNEEPDPGNEDRREHPNTEPQGRKTK